ncbi:MAG TPA: phenylalanine--tRNA ligase beta subunit-related protein [Candidatus Ozemobacteraceae bacterium]|nr:phenylalanine--tRNA ligase beta subunit-related protein [Candidatus Ozemobacteraceae bacterium]
MGLPLLFALPPGALRIGLVEAEDVHVETSRPEYLRLIADEVKSRIDPAYVYPDPLQKGIRSLLKTYGFHPSGRNRPASEFLVKDIQMRGEFNPINVIVDINNHLSLISHLPISILDLDKTGEKLCARVGMENESYVFNREGQELSLKHLLVIARSEGDLQAVGSPVKDSQATKVFESTKRVVGVVYTTPGLSPDDEFKPFLERFCELLRSQAGASRASWQILDQTC